jgi:hypothetical protein
MHRFTVMSFWQLKIVKSNPLLLLKYSKFIIKKEVIYLWLQNHMVVYGNTVVHRYFAGLFNNCLNEINDEKYFILW